MREKTVIALYDKFADASAAVEDIVKGGAPRDRISLLANNSDGDHPALAGNLGYAREQFDADSNEQSPIVTGAELGIGVGGVLGFLVGLSSLAIPGIGPLIAAGAWATAAAGAAAGGVVGGTIGALTDHGVSDKDAHLYAEGLKRGGTLVTVVIPEGDVERITQVFKTHGAVDIEKRGDHWIAEGWIAFDSGAPPLSAAEIAAARASHEAEDHAVEHHHDVRHYFNPQAGGGAPGTGISNVTTKYGEDETRA